MPAEVIMTAMGKLLIQLAAAQVGPQLTLKFFDDLQEVVQRVAPNSQPLNPERTA